MIRNGFLNQWSILQKALLFALAPLLLVSLFLTIYLTLNHLATVEKSLNQRGEGIVKTLAKSTEFGLAVDDRELINGLISAALVDHDVAGVEIYDSHGTRIAAKPADFPRPGMNTASYLKFTEQVLPPQPADQEIEEFSTPADAMPAAPIGHVHVWISRSSLDKNLRDIISRSLLLVLSVAVVSGLLSWWAVRSLVNPVKNVVNTVEELGKGKLDARVTETSQGELGVLEKGVNIMAEKIERSQSQLSDQVKEKTRELEKTITQLTHQNVELDRAREAALEASRVKESFLAQISHELRTPLNAIIGFSRLLLRPQSGDARPEYLRIILQAGDQLLTVINDVLNFSKIESGQMRIHREFFNPHEKLEEIIGLLSHEAHRKNLELVLLIHSDVPRAMYADANRFAQILINLLNNAVKFTASGQVAIIAETASSGFAVPRLKISVVDSGIGISEAVAKRLFTPFSQGDSSITKDYSGTGLGLTICKALTESMGGEIQWRNNLGAGTTFEIILPGISFFGARCLYDRSVIRGRKALVIDSHPMARRSIRNTLMSFGVEVFQNSQTTQLETLVADAEKEQAPFDIVIIGVSKNEATSLDLVHFADVAFAHDLGFVMLIGDEELGQGLLEKYQTDSMRIGIKPYNRNSLYLWVCDALQLGDVDPIQISEPPEGTASVPMRQFTALIGDDNTFGQQLLRQYLELLGAEVETADDGLAFVEAAEVRHYDLLFIDIHMPRLDGIQAAKQVRQGKGKSAGSPVIAVTADISFQLSDAILPEKNRFFSVIYKPVSEDDLRSKVKAALVFSGFETEIDTVISEADSSDQQQRRELPEGLRADLELQMNALEQALSQMDREKLKDHAHQLNGVTDFFHLPAFKSAGRELEQQALTATEETLAELVSTLRQTSDEIIREQWGS